MPQLPGADQRTDDPAAAVEAPLLALGAAFRQRDAHLLESVYADDADWTNAFGTTLRGRREIVAYLTGLFADPHFDAGTPGRPQVSVRPVTDTSWWSRPSLTSRGSSGPMGRRLGRATTIL